MNRQKKFQLKCMCLDAVKGDKEYGAKAAIFSYILYGTCTNPKFEKLTKHQQSKIYGSLSCISSSFYDFMNGALSDGWPRGFDLYLFCDQMADMVIESDNYEGRTESLYELFMIASAATFRMWFEKVTKEDVIDFLEGRPHRDLPVMNDSSAIFDWAKAHRIPCMVLPEIIGESETKRLKEMHLRKVEFEDEQFDMLYDAIRPGFARYGVPDDFVEKNSDACKRIFSAASVYYNLHHESFDLSELVDDSKKADEAFAAFSKAFSGTYTLAEIEDEEKRPFFQKLFLMGMSCGRTLNRMKSSKESPGMPPLD